jgi:hypothetical protein
MARENAPGTSRGWQTGFGALDWDADERAYASLLDALTRDRVETEAIEREMQASARRSLADLSEAQARFAQAELAEARQELGGFRAALDDLHNRGGATGDNEVAYDSSRPDQNNAADILIQYLVRPGYAEVRTEEPAPSQYVYHVRADWPRLFELAEATGHPLAHRRG